MEKVRENHAGGISMIAFIVAVAVSIGYYQYVYLPESSAKPNVPEAVANPSKTVQVSIAEGASLPSNPAFFVPKLSGQILIQLRTVSLLILTFTINLTVNSIQWKQ